MDITPTVGLIAATFTPMYANDRLHLALIPTYYQMLKKNGIKGAFICGSNGEGFSLTFSEKKEMAKAWRDCSEGDTTFKIILFLASNSIEECIELAQYAHQIGIDAVAMTAPSYFKPVSVDILAEICEKVAQSVPETPFYYYHIPSRTGVAFSMYALLEKIEGHIPNFAGIKFTNEDFIEFEACLKFENGKYDMLWGQDENIFTALALGAKGAVGSTYNYAAPLYLRLIEAFGGTDIKTAQECQIKAIQMVRLLSKYGGIATGKSFLKKIGLDCGEFRLPVQNMSALQYSQFSAEVDGIGFDSFSSKI